MSFSSRRVTVVFLLLALVASAVIVFSGSAFAAGDWTILGTSMGSTVRALVHAGSSLYAGCDNGTVYRNSLTGGEWTQFGSNTPGSNVWSLASDGTSLYAGCGNGTVYQCALAGGAWTQTGSDTPGTRVGSLAVVEGRLYAGCLDGIVYENGLDGAAWTQAGSNAPGTDVRSLAYDGTRLYAGCFSGGVYQNDLSGGAWAQTGSDTPGAGTVYALVLEESVLYAASNNGIVYQNSLSGGAWTQTGSDTPGSPVLSLASDGGNLYAGCLNGIVKSNSLSGGAWVQTGSNTPASNVHSLAYDGSTLYSGGQDGAVNAIETPVSCSAWYLAEGTTAWGFSTYLTIQNPNAAPVSAAVTYMPTGRSNVTETISLPANSQTTLTNDNLVAKMGGSFDFSTKVVSTDPARPIAVDRTMSWTGPGAASPEGHSSVGVNAPADIWYLPEGSTAWGFETWLLIQNPNPGTATCTLTYMIEGEGPQTRVKQVPGNSRQTYSMLDDIGSKDASVKVESDLPVIPERAMYRNNRREGHDSIGTTSPAIEYLLAEGATGYDVGYITYVLVQNPHDAATNVEVDYITGSGLVPGPRFTMDPNSRKTVRVNDQLPPNTDVSTRVRGSSTIIAERAMYWNNGTGEACHDSIGMSAPHSAFYLPDGESSGGRETWTLVQNPNPEEVMVEIAYLPAGGGTPVKKGESIPANSRRTFSMAEHSGVNGRASVLVTAGLGRKVMVERAMYWNSRGAGTDTIGGFSD